MCGFRASYQAHTNTQRHTQQLGDVVKGLTTQEEHPITARVARETLLASMFELLPLYKVSWYVVVFGDHSVAWYERRAVRGLCVYVHVDSTFCGHVLYMCLSELNLHFTPVVIENILK